MNYMWIFNAVKLMDIKLGCIMSLFVSVRAPRGVSNLRTL